MDLDYKQVYGNRSSQKVMDAKVFGWQFEREVSVRSGRSHHTETVLTRDKNIPHHDELVELEKQYAYYRGQMETYFPVEPLYCIICFLCLILPLVVYLLYKKSEKKRISVKNTALFEEMQEIRKEAYRLQGRTE